MEVVSASHGVLGPLLAKLTALLAGEYGRMKGVRGEILSLKSELTCMHAALKEYTMLEDPDVQVKTWISLLRELAYDTEDCIDKFIHRLGNGGRHGGFKEFFRKTARTLKTLGSRSGIADQIDDLKARIKHVQELKNRYKLDDTPCSTSSHAAVDPRLAALFAEEAHLVGVDGPRDDLAKFIHRLGNGGRHGGFKEFFRKTARTLKTLGFRSGIADQIDELKARVKLVKELKNSYKLDDTPCSTSRHAAVDPRLAALFAEEAHLVGVDGPRDDLAEWMVDEESGSTKHQRRVLSIVGFGGLGKTTLANAVDRKIQGHFNCRAFVSVSQKPDIKKITKDVISQQVDAVEELGNLTNLNQLDVRLDNDGSDGHKRQAEMLLSSLCKLGSSKLQSLRINRYGGSLEFLDSWSPPPFSLQIFYMSSNYYFTNIPKWITPALASLAFLDINLTELSEEGLHTIGELPALLCLKLWFKTTSKERLTVQGTGFPSLKEFGLHSRHATTYITFVKGAMPKLEKLKVPFLVSVAKTYGFYLGIEHLPCLKEAEVNLRNKGATSSESKAAVGAIRKEAGAHPNHLIVTFQGNWLDNEVTGSDEEKSKEDGGTDED